jgi:hypothetical protein
LRGFSAPAPGASAQAFDDGGVGLTAALAWSRVVRRRAPEPPVGWPMAMAPPLTFTRDMSGWCSFSQASTTEAKASLISTRSMSSSVSLAFWSTRVVAGMGAVSMMTGSLAATAKVWNRARGVKPSWEARSSVITRTAAAPSEICEDDAAVTCPPSTNAGGSEASFS